MAAGLVIVACMATAVAVLGFRPDRGAATDEVAPADLATPGAPTSLTAPVLPLRPSPPRAAPAAGSSPVGGSPSSGARAVAPRIPQQAGGEFATVPLTQGFTRSTTRGGLMTYTVEIERGLPFAPGSTARRVDATLADPRGWADVEDVSFRRVRAGADQRVLVASPDTTDRLCAPLQTRGRVSCRMGDLVVLNARRWAFGTDDYRGELRDYRRYVVNHEIGHALGRGHVFCPAPGEPAPVMAQQTYGLQGCRRNAWPTVA